VLALVFALLAGCGDDPPAGSSADAGPECGDAHCAADKVCCNPLMSICTKPGGVCFQ
jgi:hypothetical protein